MSTSPEKTDAGGGEAAESSNGVNKRPAETDNTHADGGCNAKKARLEQNVSNGTAASTNGGAVNNGDNDEEDEENVVTLADMVSEAEAQQKLFDDANAVLGGEDDSICTYYQGYRPRQALYSCVTCAKATSHHLPAGVCYACSVHCHDGHELVELYTKRKFRCDCGNGRCNPDGFKCALYPKKAATNEENVYNQNFSGTYCVCGRPYPDPDGDDTEDDCMVQCVVCEDWFHTRHVSADGRPKTSTDYEEMTCPACVRKHPFLRAYASRLCGSSADVEQDTSDEQVSTDAQTDACALAGVNLEKMEKEDGDVKEAVYWPAGWRAKLCLCAKCRAMYSAAGVDYLLSADDPVSAHEAKSKDDGDPFDAFMAKQPRVVQNVLLQGYTQFRLNLTRFLSECAASGKVVTSDDVAAFYRSQKANIPALVAGTPSDTCK